MLDCTACNEESRDVGGTCFCFAHIAPFRVYYCGKCGHLNISTEFIVCDEMEMDNIETLKKELNKKMSEAHDAILSEENDE